MSEEIEVSVYGDPGLPTLVYLPGLHGDWTLVTSFRAALANRLHFVVLTYPRTLKWSIEDYATKVDEALSKRGIRRGWILAESFGSQVGWALLAKDTAQKTGYFCVEGLVLAGGFVKHPFPWGPPALRWIGRATPMWLYRFELWLYKFYSRFSRKNREALEASAEFLRRRTLEDWKAMDHRLALLDDYDPREAARQTSKPVYYLAGLVDPLVPWVLVRLWLRKHCASYRGGKTCWFADHNVLSTASEFAAETILKWMRE